MQGTWQTTDSGTSPVLWQALAVLIVLAVAGAALAAVLHALVTVLIWLTVLAGVGVMGLIVYRCWRPPAREPKRAPFQLPPQPEHNYTLRDRAAREAVTQPQARHALPAPVQQHIHHHWPDSWTPADVAAALHRETQR